MAQWRPMRAADLADVDRLGSGFHVHHPEGSHIAPERLRLAPDWCFVLDDDGTFAGYFVSHPWDGALPPGLDTLIGAIPDAPGCVHLHDVVLIESARRGGHAGAMLRDLVERAARSEISRITLIAVGDAGPYWTRHGFQPDMNRDRLAFVRKSYGEDATPMSRVLPTAAA